MAERDDFRQVNNLALRPVYISLGLPQAAFKPSGFASRTRLFDAALNGDEQNRPDSIWLFRGSEYFVFNLATKEFEGQAQPIAHNWGGDTWPPMFSSGIDAAAWAGHAYPTLWYLFKGDQFIRLNSTTTPHWNVDIGPAPIKDHWESLQTAWYTTGAVALAGLSPEFHAKLHMFRGNEYLRHDFNNGHVVAGPGPIKEFWNLPEPFTNGIDLAFYGTGENEQVIYFFSGNQVALYDCKMKATIKVAPVEELFRPFARFMRRPQVFLVENYRLETYAGPPRLGNLVETRSILPGNDVKTVLVTETTTEGKESHQQSLLDNQHQSVVDNFNSSMEKKAESDKESEQYRYAMNAAFHGDASATSLWGGEVNASLAVQGGSDSLRAKLAESTFQSVETQVTQSVEQTKQRSYNSTTEVQNKERVLKQEEITLKNDTDKERIYEFYQQLQPFITLLVLTDVRVAYTDGTEPPVVVPLSGLPQLLDGKLANDEEKQKLIKYITGELSAIRDYQGQGHSVLQGDPQAAAQSLQLAPNPSSTFTIRHANGEVQNIATKGHLIKAVKDDWIKPTMTIIAVAHG